MDSFTLNKIAGAVLGTCLIGMGIGIVADEIYAPEKPKKPGYALSAAKKGGGGSKKSGEPPLSVLLAKADAKKGEADAKVCGACHNFEEGAGAKVGPDLYGVVDREKGSAQGFDYSPGMKKKGGKWTYEDLFTFLKKPSAYVQGTKMSFSGEESPEKRAEIIAYLRTLSKKPPPLPKVSEADKKAAEGGGEQAEGGGEAGGGNQLVALIGEADPKKGEADAKICSACHNFKKGEGNKVGPDLYGVVDREKGSVQGFDYSPGMKKKGGKWTYEDLDKFLTKPSAYVQGTKMGFGGESNDKKRASIIAYLRSNADKPAPLPKASGGGKKEAAKSESKGGGGGDAFAKLVAAADPKKGESTAQICGACHNFKKGEGAKVGPDLYGVVDREKGSVEGFSYSPGMKKKGGKWTYDDLNQFLTKPSAYIQGTKMGFGGEADEKKRAAIVAYLRSNADKPAPLPGAEGGEKKSEAAPPAKSDDKKSDDKKSDDKKAGEQKSGEKADDKKQAAPEKKTEGPPAKSDEKKAEDKKPAEPEKKTEAAPGKPENKAEAKPAGAQPDDKKAAEEKKAETKPEPSPPEQKAEAKPDSSAGDQAEAKPAPTAADHAASSGSGGVKMEEADLGPPQPYSAPTPQAPALASSTGKEAPVTDDKAVEGGPPNPYSAPAPRSSESASTGNEPTSAPEDKEAYGGGPPEPYSAPTPQSTESASTGNEPSSASEDKEAYSGGPPEPYSAPSPQGSAEATEQKTADAPSASSIVPYDQTAGGGPEPYSAPTPDEAAASAK